MEKHKNGTLSPSEYFDEVVKKHNEYDLPQEFRPQDEESESEETDSEESD